LSEVQNLNEEKQARLDEIAYAIQCELECMQEKIHDTMERCISDGKSYYEQSLSMARLYIAMADRLRVLNALQSLDIETDSEDKFYSKLQLKLKENSDSSDEESLLDMLSCEINLEEETADYVEKSLEQFIEKL